MSQIRPVATTKWGHVATVQIIVVRDIFFPVPDFA
jgi:hypothetical protein